MSSQTPNLHLILPDKHTPNWDIAANNNLVNIDLAITAANVTAQAAEVAANKNKPNGYAPLDISGHLPILNLPNIPESKIINLTADLSAKTTKDYVDTQDLVTLTASKTYTDTISSLSGIHSIGVATDISYITIGNTPLIANGTITLVKTDGLTANQFVATPDGTTGKADLRSIVPNDIPNLNTAKLTSGQLAMTRGGTGVDLSTSGSTISILAQDASHVISSRVLVAADIPSLAASIITSGTLALARGGTNSNLSVTGGNSNVLMQNSIGAAVTVAQLTFGNISGTVSSGQIPAVSAGAILGQVNIAHGGTSTNLSASGGPSQVLMQPVFGNAIQVRQLIYADISDSLNTSILTAGQLLLARGGTGADLSATGGTSRVLRQSGVGSNISVSQLSFVDISGTASSFQIPQINLASSGAGGVGGNLPVGNLASGAGAGADSVWRGDGLWANGVNGNWLINGVLDFASIAGGSAVVRRIRGGLVPFDETGTIVVGNNDLSLIWTGSALDLYVDGERQGSFVLGA